MSDGDWEAFGERCGSALAQVIRRRPEPFEALWWHGDDVSILGALGGREFGWGEIGPRLDYASTRVRGSDFRIENAVTFVDDDVAYTADFEHMERTLGDRTRHRILRAAQVYRRIGGEWKIVHPMRTTCSIGCRPSRLSSRGLAPLHSRGR